MNNLIGNFGILVTETTTMKSTQKDRSLLHRTKTVGPVHPRSMKPASHGGADRLGWCNRVASRTRLLTFFFLSAIDAFVILGSVRFHAQFLVRVRIKFHQSNAASGAWHGAKRGRGPCTL